MAKQTIEFVQDEIIKTRRSDGSLRIIRKSKMKSQTQQQFAPGLDMNNIITKYNNGGGLPNPVPVKYGDVSGVKDYKDVLNLKLEHEQIFNSLSAQVRAKFDNDPTKMIAYLQDKKNLEESYELGLRQKPAEQPADKIVNSLKGLTDEVVKSVASKSPKSETPK